MVILFNTTTNAQSANKSTATVNQIKGYYIFVDCKPDKEYEFLGTVETGGGIRTGSAQYVMQITDGRDFNH